MFYILIICLAYGCMLLVRLSPVLRLVKVINANTVDVSRQGTPQCARAMPQACRTHEDHMTRARSHGRALASG